MSAPRLFEQPTGAPITIGDLIAAYQRHMSDLVSSGDLSEVHRRNTTFWLDDFQEFIGPGKHVSDCRQYDLTQWLAARPNWKSKFTIRNYTGAVITAFRWAEDEELIDRAPYRPLKKLKGAVYGTRRPALREEYLALIRAGSHPLRVALMFLWRTGARTSEMRAVRWEDVHFGSEPFIKLAKHKTVRRTGMARIIVLDRWIARLLWCMKISAKSEYVFVNMDGEPWTSDSFSHHLRRCLKRIGLDPGVAKRVTGYCFRHAWTCRFLKAGGTPKEAADMQGQIDDAMAKKVYGWSTSQDVAYLSRLLRKGLGGEGG